MSRILLVAGLVCSLLVTGLVVPPNLTAAGDGSGDRTAGFEVWLIDQADTTADGGGTVFIFEGADLTGQAMAAAVPQQIDLGDAARTLCLDQTGSAPRRPHMLLFNTGATHAVISFVATGHVLFMDAVTRTPVACIDAGEQAHAAFPTLDERYVIVANQNGKLLQRIRSDYSTNTFVLEDDATLNLATCTTPSGAPCQAPDLRPDNAPICPIVDSSSRFAFVTLRGGGLFVVDLTATPMAIVAEYSREVVKPNGCGGVEVGGTMFINSGGGTSSTPLTAVLYAFPMNGFSVTPGPLNTPLPAVVFEHEGFVDSHGAVLAGSGGFLWVVDRAANTINIVDTLNSTVVNEIVLAGALSGDPAPDLLDVSPDGGWVFVSLRGPNPLTANVADVNNAVGSTPGVGVIRVDEDGYTGEFVTLAPVSRIVDGVQRADPHGLRVRRK